MTINFLSHPKFTLFDKGEIERSISRRFEQQVERFPSQLAVKTYEHRITYDQLNRAANRLARSILAQRGEGHELIPILFEHGAMMLIGMLGVLKAGKGWVPIDPWYPPARISHILNTFQASLLVTNNRNLPLIEAVKGEFQVINLDEIDNTLSDENLELPIPSDTIACVLPTSGSTGEPKGVVHNHRNLLHNCMRWTNAFCICPEDRLLLLNSYCHIGGINNIFSVLLNGATSCPFNLKERELTELTNWLIAEEITIYHSVSTVFRHFIDSLSGKEEFSKLRLIHLGGEPVSKQDFELYKKHFSQDCIFLNSFGCTELSSYRQYFADKSTQITSNVVPVGYAAEDTEVLLLDENGEEVGFNRIGEIVVKSQYLALGYWERPDLDAVSFLLDPQNKSKRLYRTGDLGKMLPDGCLIHLGRKDSQVQIRGYRVEVSECEAVLTEHPQVKEAAVIAWDNAQDEKSLVAYVVLHPGQTICSSDLQNFLRQKLPSYMVPSGFMFLDALPLNPNGKIDRLALPDLDQLSQHQLANDQSFTEPQDELEVQLVRIWERLLGIQPISVQDDFFALGGHSLLAVQLFAEIEKVFGKNLPLATLFQAATVKDLANIIRQQNWLAPWSSLVPMQPNGSKLPLFYMHAGGGNLLIYRELAYSLGSDQPVYGLQPRGLDGKFDPFQTVEDMADYYLAQILKVQPEGPYFLAGLSSGGATALEIAQRLHAKGQEVAFLAMFDTAGPNYYEALPLVPRLISVLGWFITDWTRRVSSWPQKAIRLIRQEGWSKTYRLILKRIGLVRADLDEDRELQMLRTRSVVEADIKEYQAQAENWLEKWVNTLLIFLLRNSSAPHYAGVFARGLVRQSNDLLIDILPRSLYQVQKATCEAANSYIPEPYRGHITYFQASEFPPGIYPPVKGGWNNIAVGGIEVFKIPGNHTSIMKSPVLAEALKACLEQAQAKALHEHSDDEHE